MALGEMCFGAWGQLKRGFVMVASIIEAHYLQIR